MLKAGDEVGVVEQGGSHDFQSHFSVKSGITGYIDGGKTASSYFMEDFIFAELTDVCHGFAHLIRDVLFCLPIGIGIGFLAIGDQFFCSLATHGPFNELAGFDAGASIEFFADKPQVKDDVV